MITTYLLKPLHSFTFDNDYTLTTQIVTNGIW